MTFLKTMTFLLHTLIGKFPEFLQLISTETDPRSLQMLRCTSKAFRDGADKEQCTASAVAKYTRATLCNGAFFRINSLYGYHVIDIFPITNDSGIDANEGNVIVKYDNNGRRFIGFISGEFDNRTEFDVINLGRDVFNADSRQSIDLCMYTKVWISMNDYDDDDVVGDIICVRVNLDAGGLIGEVFADCCLYSV